MSEQAAAGVRVNGYGRGEATVETGLPVLNRLIVRLAETARFDLVLDIEPGDTQAEGDAAAARAGAAPPAPGAGGGPAPEATAPARPPRRRPSPTSCSRRATSRSSSRT